MKRPRSAFARLLRLGRLTAHVGRGLIILSIGSPSIGAAGRGEAISRWSRQLLHIVGVELRVGAPPASRAGMMLVMNHVSWLDIFAVLSVMPARFVAKSEIRRWPFIGRLAAGAGTLFIARGSKSHARRTTLAIAAAIRGGDIVAICPEGTTSEGDVLLPFHPALFQPAIDAKTQIQLLAVRYFEAENRPSKAAAFVGTLSLIGSVWKILGRQDLRVDLSFLETVPADGGRRRELARSSEAAIADALGVHVLRSTARPAATRPPGASR